MYFFCHLYWRISSEFCVIGTILSGTMGLKPESKIITVLGSWNAIFFVLLIVRALSVWIFSDMLGFTPYFCDGFSNRCLCTVCEILFL
jgi:hypothetical protein